MTLKDSLKDLSHHAYCLVGNDSIREELISILTKTHKLKTRGNPDFFDRRFEVMNIDEAREIKSLAGTRPVSEDGKKIFILTMNGITVEAQNALLKLLEEAPADSHFFLIIPSAHLLLPTIKSRLSFIGDQNGKGTEDTELLKITKGFLASSKKERLEEIKSLMEEIGKEKRPKQDALDFMNALEEAVHAGGAKKNARQLEAILNAKRYMNDRAPSLKMLLEYVALNV